MQFATAYWRYRAETFGPGWTKHYWNSWQAPYRQALADAIGACGPIGSILEVGCHVGPNLRLWRQRWPEAVLFGLDVSPQAIQFGREHFAGDPDLHLWLEDYLTAPFFPMADIVAACYALSYADPGALPAVLEQCWRSARRAVVLAEPMALDGLPAGPCKADMEEWRHDYVQALTDLGARHVEVRLVTPPADGTLNGILIARKD